jgi:hypothetical protein
MIARILVLFLTLSMVSCDKTNDNQILFDLIVNESHFTEDDSIKFNRFASNNEVIEFFRLRNTKNIVFKQIIADSVKPLIQSDSTYHKIDSIAYYEKKVKGNYYLTKGKGINNDVELFLKDSFNYKFSDSIYWKIPEKFNNSILHNTEENKSLSISKPVYNLERDKAIVLKRIHSNRFEHKTIYFFKKINNEWFKVYSQSNN